MNTIVHLALTDDWELRGDGSGDVHRLQFQPMRELVRLFNAYGVRGTFNAEMMQQLTFRKLQTRHPELKALADSWDEHVLDSFRQGHDIQLHAHPQWLDAQYQNGRWYLPSDWSILRHEPDAAYAMLSEGKKYLENLLRPVDTTYRCISFRAGSSCIAPSPFILSLLAEVGLIFDMSIIGGLHVKTQNLQIDYTDCEEDFLPFYPRMEDARKVSYKQEPIMCVPIFHFYGSRRRVFMHILSLGWRKARIAFSGGSEKRESRAHEDYAKRMWAETGHSSACSRIYEKAIKPCLTGKHLTADIGRLDYAFLSEMLCAIRRQARETGLKEVPVILTNHSKYIEDFTSIELFLQDASKCDDIRFITLTELARRLQPGEFQVRRALATRGG